MASKARELVAQKGKPLPEILKEEYERYGNQTAVARALGVSQPTVSLWLAKLGMMEWTTLVPAGFVVTEEGKAALSESAK